MSIKSIGSFLFLLGLFIIVLDFVYRVPNLLFWIHNWWEVVVWIIKILLLISWAILFYVWLNKSEYKKIKNECKCVIDKCIIYKKRIKKRHVIITTVIIVLLIIAYLLINFFLIQFSKVIVDNPTKNEIIVSLDEKNNIKIPANSNAIIEVNNGEHSLYINWEKVGDFTKKFFDTNSFLNPTNEIYVSEYILYWNKDFLDRIPNNKISLYGDQIIEGPFKKYHWIYITWKWDYQINEAFPNDVDLRKWWDFKIKEKIYRNNDFIKMYNEKYYTEE